MIRLAQEKDIPRIGDLLRQVDLVHHNGRPDIFKIGRKYNDRQLKELLTDSNRPILVWTDADDTVQGYCFCVLQQHTRDNVLTDIKTLYIDDLCVDEAARGRGIGRALYEFVRSWAKGEGYDHITLHVWNFPGSAVEFYRSLGMGERYYCMEEKL